MRRPESDPSDRTASVAFDGVVNAVKARIRLLRSFDEVSHQYQGYTLVIAGSIGGAAREEIRVGIGPAAYEKHRFRIGDKVSGKARAVEDEKSEWAQFNRASALKIVQRGPATEDRAADPEGGVAPPLEEYRANGHRRLDPKTCATTCTRCPFGLTMATEITVDQWNRGPKKWRFETHCYGPIGCPRYRAGAARRVQGRKPGMVWVDDDVEREASEIAIELQFDLDESGQVQNPREPE